MHLHCDSPPFICHLFLMLTGMRYGLVTADQTTHSYFALKCVHVLCVMRADCKYPCALLACLFQTLFDPYFISLYNVFYTSLPILVLGIFDQVCPVASDWAGLVLCGWFLWGVHAPVLSKKGCLGLTWERALWDPIIIIKSVMQKHHWCWLFFDEGIFVRIMLTCIMFLSLILK